MAQTVNYIVAKTSPNLYAAAKQANLSQTQVNQIEQFSFTVDKNKQLLRKPLDTARQDFFKLDEEVQQMLRFLYPDAEYAKEAPDSLHVLRERDSGQSSLGYARYPASSYYERGGKNLAAPNC